MLILDVGRFIIHQVLVKAEKANNEEKVLQKQKRCRKSYYFNSF